MLRSSHDMPTMPRSCGCSGIEPSRAPLFLATTGKAGRRVEAHIDGLRVAGDHGWRLSEKALDWKQTGEVFTAGVLALESNDPVRLNRVLEFATTDRKLEAG